MGIDSTIAAVSTPPGEGGIGIVRMSGPEACAIACKIFKPANKNLDIKKAATHSFHYGYIVSRREIIDEVLINIMKAPRTYTREDIVEVNCHGGIIPLKRTLDLVLSKGARLARPGEFTERAFINGRIDLSQAEAVADIINAKTQIAGKIATSHLTGLLRDKIDVLTQNISHILAEVEANIEFPDEAIQDEKSKSHRDKINEMLQDIRKLISSGEIGKIIREGVNVVIAGRPNVGKSSLFNAVMGEERVIVTPYAGTTRDIVEGTISIKGIAATLADTAGINNCPDDIIGKEAVKRSSARAEGADIIVFVIDGSEELTKGDISILENLEQKPVFIALNKSDLPQKADVRRIKKRAGKIPITKTSAATGEGIEKLLHKIADYLWTGSLNPGESLAVSNRRHLESLKKAETAMREAKQHEGSLGNEILAHNLRRGLDALGEICGRKVNEEILSEIFSRFCVGK
jgi:tRNA modification GTPase